VDLETLRYFRILYSSYILEMGIALTGRFACLAPLAIAYHKVSKAIPEISNTIRSFELQQ